ncbi:hypothetical protein A8926_6090 [Saccharopolyspora spinosa]|uniref:Uncharacterized protein n=1 Tax=Saccharopolyspora spinosa TaxID=60894 RepID=A0A2N3Y526_SACSN|nr:hypothetical protein A8926_6090 [Saccharopolyspora spinosa]
MIAELRLCGHRATYVPTTEYLDDGPVRANTTMRP